MTSLGTSRGPKRARFVGFGVAAMAFAVAIATGCSSEVEPGAANDGRVGRDAASGSQGGGDGGSQPGNNDPNNPNNPTADDAGPPVIECSPIMPGTSSVKVNGVVRQFNVTLPANTTKMALLFQWHGWMQDPKKFSDEIVYDVALAKWVPFDPNAFGMPLMLVTPFDTKMIPPWGLDWDIATGGKDFQFFDGMMQCINAQFSIEQKRIYSFGFSAGAVFSNLLAAKNPDLFAATVSESGAWFGDPTQAKEVLVPIVAWKWPALDPADRGNVLLTHGGKNDFATVISLENCAVKALPFLATAKRTVTDCVHNFGHTLAPDLTQSMIYEYLWSHELGGGPISSLPPSFPTPGKPVGSTSCTFHPAP